MAPTDAQLPRGQVAWHRLDHRIDQRHQVVQPREHRVEEAARHTDRTDRQSDTHAQSDALLRRLEEVRAADRHRADHHPDGLPRADRLSRHDDRQDYVPRDALRQRHRAHHAAAAHFRHAQRRADLCRGLLQRGGGRAGGGAQRQLSAREGGGTLRDRTRRFHLPQRHTGPMGHQHDDRAQQDHGLRGPFWRRQINHREPARQVLRAADGPHPARRTRPEGVRYAVPARQHRPRAAEEPHLQRHHRGEHPLRQAHGYRRGGDRSCQEGLPLRPGVEAPSGLQVAGHRPLGRTAAARGHSPHVPQEPAHHLPRRADGLARRCGHRADQGLD